MTARLHPDDIQAIAERVVLLIGQTMQPAGLVAPVISPDTPLSEVPATAQELIDYALRKPSLLRQAEEQRRQSAERKARKQARRAA